MEEVPEERLGAMRQHSEDFQIEFLRRLQEVEVVEAYSSDSQFHSQEAVRLEQLVGP